MMDIGAIDTSLMHSSSIIFRDESDALLKDKFPCNGPYLGEE